MYNLKRNYTVDNEDFPDDTPSVPVVLPSIQYSREEMLLLEKSDFSLLRPTYLDIQFDRFDF